MAVRRGLANNIVYLGIVKAVEYGVPLAVIPIIISRLGVDYFGVFATALAVNAIVNVVVDFGFTLTATREVSLHRDKIEYLGRVYGEILVFKLIIFSALYAAMALAVSNLPGFSEQIDIYLITVLGSLGVSLTPLYFYMGQEKMQYIAAINVSTKLIYVLGVLIFLRDEGDGLVAPLAFAISSLLGGFFSLVQVAVKYELPLALPSLLSLRKRYDFSKDFAVSRFYSLFYREFNVIALSFYVPSSVVGVYALAEKIIKAIQGVQEVIGNALYPRVAAGEIQIFDRPVWVASVSAIYLIGTIVVVSLSDVLADFFKGGEAVSYLITLLSPVIFFGGMNYFYGILGVVAAGHTAVFRSAVLIAGIISVASVVVLAGMIGEYGAVVSFIMSEFSLLVILVIHTYKRGLK
jgi:PST family polysaccharide transporter